MTSLNKTTWPAAEPHLPEESTPAGRPAPDPSAPEPVEDDEPALPIRRLVAGVYRRIWQIWLFGVLGVVVGVAIAVLRPESFESEGVFLLDAGGEQVRIVTDPLLENTTSGISGNLPYVLTSHELCARVVDEVGPEAILAPPRETVVAEADAELMDRLRAWFANLRELLGRLSTVDIERDEAIEALQDNLDVRVPAYSSVLFVGYTAPDPVAARDTLSVYMRHAIKWHLEVYGDSREIELLERRYEEVEARHAEAKRNYAELLKTVGVHDFREALAKTRERLTELEEAAEDAAHRVATGELQQRRLTAELDKTEPTILVTELVSRIDPEVEALEAALQGQLRELADLQSRLREDDLRIKRARDTLERIEDQLERARRDSSGSYSQQRRRENPRYESVRRELFDVEFGLAQSRLDADRLREKVSAAKTALASLEQREAEHEELLAAVDEAESELEAMDARMARVQTKRALSQNDLSSLSVLQQPLMGERKSIRVLVLLGAALVAGIGFGLVLSLARAWLDRRVLFASDLEAVGCGPVLGVLPDRGRRHVVRHLKERRRS